MSGERVYVVDDERLTRETLVEQLRDEGFDAFAFPNGWAVLEALEAEEADAVLTDLRMPSMDGAELYRRIEERWPDIPVIFMTAFATVASAVEAMRSGAADYLTKPLNSEELLIRLRRIIQHRRDTQEIRRLRAESARRGAFGQLIYRSDAMGAVVRRALTVADTDLTVLIQGETGTGKEILARSLHAHSGRAPGPFVAVNCGGLNPNLVESELFGHEAGAFTGATRMRKGRIESAIGGTLFIDEVDDLTQVNQLRILRFLQERTFERVGSSRTLEADVRVLCATKCNLEDMVRQGAFREDLYYRIAAVVITLPPLRDRRDDILPLAELFLAARLEASGAPGLTFGPEAMRALLAHDWPGNVRELRHAVEHAAAFAEGGVIEPRHLPDRMRGAEGQGKVHLDLPSEGAVSMPGVLSECEGELLAWALERAGGNQVRAAELLGIPRTTLRSRLEARGELAPLNSKD